MTDYFLAEDEISEESQNILHYMRLDDIVAVDIAIDIPINKDCAWNFLVAIDWTAGEIEMDVAIHYKVKKGSNPRLRAMWINDNINWITAPAHIMQYDDGEGETPSG